MKRIDIHRPSAINTEGYVFVAFECLPGANEDPVGWAYAQQQERATIRAHMAHTGGTYSTHAHGGVCMVCGNANAIYTALFWHEPTNSYVRVGQDCAQKIEMQALDFTGFIARVKDALAARAGKRKAEATLAAAGLERAWALYEELLQARADYNDAFTAAQQRFEDAQRADRSLYGTDQGDDVWRRDYQPARPAILQSNDVHTLADIVGRLVRYGGISEKQEAFLGRLVERIDHAEEIEAERAKEREAAAPAPRGRVEVTGEILSVKAQEGYAYADSTLKMLVKAAAGWKLWVTVPAALMEHDVGNLRGRAVTLRVTVEPSRDDPKFAFGKRPHVLDIGALVE